MGKRFSGLSILVFLTLVVTLLSSFLVVVPAAQGQEPRPVVRYATRSDITGPLRLRPQLPPMPKVLGAIFERPRKLLPNREGTAGPGAPDPVLQAPVSGTSAPSTESSFEGIGNVNGVLPPDTVGDVGPNHYVQMVNLSLAIFNRAGQKVYGPVNSNVLWQGFGGPCETTNDGDPIVLYDELADRWLVSQFALPNFPRGPYYQCVAVSQSADPTASWYRYEFTISDTKLNDYPKFGVWPDGYYMSINQFKCSGPRCSWAGAGAVAFERQQMLSGGAARMVYFDLQTVDPNLGGMLPADLDGPAPPAGTPNPFVQVDDNAWGYASQDQLQIWSFDVDWTDPANSTFALNRAVPTASFDANMCGYSRNCIPQPGGTAVDAISDRLMFRLQYRNFGTYQTLVTNHTVDTNGANHAGIRWYELRNTGSGWGIYQQGTYAPDNAHRWMGSVAMNGAGDMALGYSVSSATTYPSIRFTGRLAGDPLGQMTLGEGTIINGSGYQTHSSGRWGDYSMMAVDPVDDTTFWYTQEYYATASNASWRTRIASFKLAGSGPADTPPTVSITDPLEGEKVSGIHRVLVEASDDGSITRVWLSIDGGSEIDIANLDAGRYYYDWDTTGHPDGAGTLRARAIDDADQSSSSALVNVVVDNINDLPVAAFSYTCIGLDCTFDASSSFDPDGNITTYAWDWGDGNSGSGQKTGHSYASAGTYTVVLTVTDDRNATDLDSQNVTVDDSVLTMFIGDIAITGKKAGPNRDATVIVTIQDTNGNPIEGATVVGTWSGDYSASVSGITAANGQVTFTSGKVRQSNATFTFTVADVLRSGHTYDETLNAKTSVTTTVP